MLTVSLSPFAGSSTASIPNGTEEAESRSEVMRTIERLEGVQKHVMLEASDAREAHKRADDQATMALQRADKLAVELEAL